MDAFSPPERNRQKHQECQQVEHHHQTNHSWELVTFILRLLAVWLGGRCVVCANFAHTTSRSNSPSLKMLLMCFVMTVRSLPKSWHIWRCVNHTVSPSVFTSRRTSFSPSYNTICLPDTRHPIALRACISKGAVKSRNESYPLPPRKWNNFLRWIVLPMSPYFPLLTYYWPPIGSEETLRARGVCSRIPHLVAIAVLCSLPVHGAPNN